MNFLDRIILDNTIKSYLIVFGAIFLILLLRRILSRFFTSLLCRFIERNGKPFDKKSFIALIAKPISWFIVIVIAVFALDKLNFPGQWQYAIYGISIQTIFEKTGVIMIIISFFRCLVRFIDFIASILKSRTGLTRSKGDDQLIVFFSDFLKVIIIITAILFVIKVGLNKNIGTLVTGLSIVGAAVALAAKESLENLIASFIIFFDKPFYVGDYLKVNNVSGRVEKVGLRSTRIRTPDKTIVTVPNKQMVDSIVDNWSKRNQQRTEVKLELSPKTKSAILLSFLDEVKKLLSEKKDILKYNVFFSEFLKNSPVVTIEYFSKTATIENLNQLRTEINLQLKQTTETFDLKTAPQATDIVMEQKQEDPEPPKQEPLI